MKKTLILLAGYPATGKSYLMKIIKKNIPDLKIISPDQIKESIWDRVGFNNLQEKEELDAIVWSEYYQEIDSAMKMKNSIISDYPFSNKQKKQISYYSELNNYQIITLRLVGNIDVLYNRSSQRDSENNRHIGHLLNSYHYGDIIEQRLNADGFVTKEIFMDRCLNRGYADFSLGFLYEVDVTDYTKIDYEAIVQFIQEKLRS